MSAAGGQAERASGSSDMIEIVLFSLCGNAHTLNIHGSDPIYHIFDRYADLTGTRRDEIRLFFAGRALEDDPYSSVRHIGLTDGSRVHVVRPLRGGKPVVYLYPPTAMDVSVKLSLIPAWEFSALYPLTAIKKLELANGQVEQHIEWNVHANPSGLLRDKLSGKDITYLFWEAEYAGCLALLFQIDNPFSGHARPPLNYPSRLLPLMLTLRPLTLVLPRTLHSTPRHLK